jgi:hypothetical protein
MAKIDLSNMTKAVGDQLKGALNELFSPVNLQEIAELIVADIIKRTKLGYSINEELGSQSPMKSLSPAYVGQRKKSKLDSSTTAKKSNLTNTGDMLNDLKIRHSKGIITIYLGSKFSNQKATWQAESGRQFMHISKVQFSKITTIVKNKLKEYLNKG